MKQRLGIAAAIMEDPDIIILDEPINALDDSGTEQVRQILMKHKQRGALIIIACHDADELEFLSDEIIEIAVKNKFLQFPVFLAQWKLQELFVNLRR